LHRAALGIGLQGANRLDNLLEGCGTEYQRARSKTP
jgi:hypothetical protein